MLRISIYVFLENRRNVYKTFGTSNSEHFLNRSSLSAGHYPHLSLLCFVPGQGGLCFDNSKNICYINIF